MVASEDAGNKESTPMWRGDAVSQIEDALKEVAQHCA